MFSDAPLSATPLASGGGTTWLVSILEGVGGTDAASAASVLLGAVLVAGAAADITSASAVFAGVAVEGVSGADTIATLQAFNIQAREAPAAADTASISAGVFLIQAVDGAAGVDYHTMRVVFEGAVVEDSVPTVLGSMTQLWEFIGTGVSAGWQAVPTGTPNAWTLIKTRND